jgi:serine/threonine-protein kinase
MPPSIHIIEKISEGGMGAVYRARHAITGAKIAVKLLLREHASREKYVSRFIREARMACVLSNPHIVAVHDCGITTDGLPYIVMDYVEGVTLEELLDSGMPLKGDQALDIFIQTAEALAHAHKRGIIHRDIKPSNIMLTVAENETYFVRMVDFGIAKITDSEMGPNSPLTMTGEVLGTPTYMSPEQCMGKELDGRSDIYGLGCVMYHTLTGRPPFTGTTTLHVLLKHSHDPVPQLTTEQNVKLPKGLEAIVKRCLEKSPQDRYATMDEVIVDLRKIKEGESITIRISGHQKWMLGLAARTLGSGVVGFLIAWAVVSVIGAFNK